MKTKMKYLAGMALFLFIAMGVNAQTPNQVVTKGAVKNYEATNDHTPNYSLGWTVEGSGNTLTPASGKTTAVTWNAAAGTYKLFMTETNTVGGSCATINEFLVRIIAKPVLQFSATTSNSCADAAQTLTLTYRFEGTSTDITVGSNPEYFPFTVTYKVVDADNSLDATRTLTVNTEADLKIELSNTDRIDLAPFTPSRSIVVTLNNDAVASNATLPNTFPVALGTNTANTNTVYDIPETNAIKALD